MTSLPTRLRSALPLACFVLAAALPQDSRPTEPAKLAPADAATDAVVERIEARVTKHLDELRERGDLPGLSAALVLPGGRELGVAVGVTDPDGGRALTPQDLLLSGSIGKTYVAAMALELAAEGKLDLDAKAAKHLGDEPWFARLAGHETFTVRQLLRHESGLARYVYAPDFWEALTEQTDKAWQPHELLAYIADRPGLFEPGEGWAYADTNYIIVGVILEQLAERSMYDHVRTRFLEPHGLSGTLPSDSRRIEGLVQGHTSAFGAFGLPPRVLDEEGTFIINPQFEWCGGGFANTPLDLARWARIYFSGSAFEGEYLDELLATVPADRRLLGPDARYGPGCIQRKTDLGELRGHDGTMVGYEASMGWFVELDVAVAVMANQDDNRALGRPVPGLLQDLARIAGEELGLVEDASEEPAER